MVTVAILEMMHSEAIGDCEYFESCGGGVGGGLAVLLVMIVDVVEVVAVAVVVAVVG